MARLHGEGVRTWWEGGVYRVHYRKETAGQWKIGRLEYDTLFRADYRPGKSYAQPISVPRLAARFPADQHRPDDLLQGIRDREEFREAKFKLRRHLSLHGGETAPPVNESGFPVV
ncbi:MAG TPA: hypothetical protein VFY29_14430 [Terriglobia bacterium]|nr:hypothetical protein [Terriglobia bacterium]